jgi:hypothetical protein
MLAISCLKNFRPLMATPTHSHSVFTNFHISVVKLIYAAQRHGLSIDFLCADGESLITRARNNIVASFLAEPAWTHLIWIDADIGFEPDALFRLLLSDHDVAAGVYPRKLEHWPAGGPPAGMAAEHFRDTYALYPVNTAETSQGNVELEILPDGFMKLDEATTGFMCIKRTVFERMMTAYPDLQYLSDTPGRPDAVTYRFFDVSVHPETKRYLSEDFTFCRLWQAIGGEIHVDATSNLSHQGYKRYGGDFGETLRLNLAHCVGARAGSRLTIKGLEYLERNRSNRPGVWAADAALDEPSARDGFVPRQVL